MPLTQITDTREQNTKVWSCANMVATSHTSDWSQVDLGFHSNSTTWRCYLASPSVGFLFHKMGLITELNNKTHLTLPMLVMNSCDNVYKGFRTVNTYSLSEAERSGNRANEKHKVGAEYVPKQ